MDALRMTAVRISLAAPFFEDIMIQPLSSKIAVKRITPTKMSAGGILLQRIEEPERGEVVALGPKITEVEVGDIILLNWNGAIKSGEDGLYVVDIEHVVLIFGEDE